MRKIDKYSKEELQKKANESYSMASFVEKIGYSKAGGSTIKMVKEYVSENDIDISHFKGQGWSKDNFDYSRFKYGNSIKIASALPALVNLKGHKCEQCGSSVWNQVKIPLEIHHNDGDHLNNELDNLVLLCPNCHALTENYKGRNHGNKHKYTDDEYAEALKNSNSVRQALLSLGLNGSGGNYARAYDIINKYKITHLMKR